MVLKVMKTTPKAESSGSATILKEMKVAPEAEPSNPEISTKDMESTPEVESSDAGMRPQGTASTLESKTQASEDAHEIIIAVMGPTGAGKTHFVRAAGVPDIAVGNGLTSHTKQITKYIFPMCNVKSALEILRPLLNADGTKLKIQEEICEQNKKLIETKAGQVIYKEAEAAQWKAQRDLKQLEVDNQRAIKRGDKQVQAELASEIQVCREKFWEKDEVIGKLDLGFAVAVVIGSVVVDSTGVGLAVLISTMLYKWWKNKGYDIDDTSKR